MNTRPLPAVGQRLHAWWRANINGWSGVVRGVVDHQVIARIWTGSRWHYRMIDWRYSASTGLGPLPPTEEEWLKRGASPCAIDCAAII